MMSRMTPRRLPVRPGPIGVSDVAQAMRRILHGEERPVAIAPAVLDDSPSSHHAAALAAALRDDAPIDRDDAAVVMPTSGSTGEPHGVLLSTSALVAAADRGAATLGAPGLWLVAVPVTGIGGAIAVLRSVRSGHEPVALPSVGGAGPFLAEEFAQTARQVQQQAQQLGAPAYVSLVPTQLRRLVADGGAGLDALTGFGAVLVGGAAVRDEDRDAARARGIRLVETYGATETCGGVIYNGDPIPGVELRFIDPDSGVTGADGPGRIVIDGPTLALGYRLRPDLTEAAFHDDGFHSPDVGHRVPGGLAVDSRLDHIVKVGGVKVSLSAVSNALRSHPQVIDALTVAESDTEWGAVPTSFVVTDADESGGEQLRTELRALVADRLGRASQPRRIDLVERPPAGPDRQADPAHGRLVATAGQWVAGARPRTLPAAVAPVAAGSGVAAVDGSFIAGRALLALAVALCLQIGVNYANDYSDGIRGTDDARIGPVRLVGQRLAPPAAVRRAAILSLLAAAALGLLLVVLAQAWAWLAVGAASIAAAWLYTGGPRPYGYAGLGELFVFLFFGPVAVLGTAYVQAGTVTWLGVAASVAIGLLSALILVANNLRDIPTDLLSGKRTLAVALGDSATRTLFTVGALAAFLAVALVAAAHPGALAGLAGAVPMAAAVREVRGGTEGRALIPVLGRTSLALLLTGVGLGLGLALLG